MNRFETRSRGRPTVYKSHNKKQASCCARGLAGIHRHRVYYYDSVPTFIVNRSDRLLRTRRFPCCGAASRGGGEGARGDGREVSERDEREVQISREGSERVHQHCIRAKREKLSGVKKCATVFKIATAAQRNINARLVTRESREHTCESTGNYIPSYGKYISLSLSFSRSPLLFFFLRNCVLYFLSRGLALKHVAVIMCAQAADLRDNANAFANISR